ncbi:hypothetical protein VKT23_014507 [Stygiomarasmius scandens]|uniref:Cytochrome P450 n=1 Tax=Marasmiellus scandens TaxID=2682957 RepID=A0ABR1J0D8_9AGAR
MVKNPEILRKGQEAVDKITSGDRLPSFADVGSIPFVDALVRETLRWNPILPLSTHAFVLKSLQYIYLNPGVPYQTVQDDEYEGYYIPAGATVVGNSWAVLHDEATFGPQPHLFNPERFLKADGTLNPSIIFPDAAFGFGRRICAGNEMAVSSLWISIACILSCFDISKAADEDGNPIEPSGEYTSVIPFRSSAAFDPEIKVLKS